MLKNTSVSENGEKQLPRRKPTSGMGRQGRQFNRIKQLARMGFNLDRPKRAGSNQVPDAAGPFKKDESVKPVEVVEVDERPYHSNQGSAVVASSSLLARAFELSVPGSRRYGLAVLLPNNLWAV